MGGVRVLYNGVNVTPQSLLRPSSEKTKPGSRGRKASGNSSPTKRPSAATGGGVAPRKKSSLSAEAQRAAAAARAVSPGGGGGKSQGRRKRGEGPVAEEGGLTEEDLNAPITVRLCETPTVMLLEIRGSAVATDVRDFGRYK